MKELNVPEISEADMYYPTMEADKELLAIAEERGFLYGRTKYNDLFSSLFFGGGKINIKKDMDVEYGTKLLKYLKAFMGTWGCKHEHKEAICALILSELVEEV